MAANVHLCRLGVFCVVRQSSPRRADHSSRGVLTVWFDREASVRKCWPARGCCVIDAGGEGI